MSHLRHLAALAIAAVVAVALTAAPAQAGKQTTTDQKRDVYKVPFSSATPHLVRDDRAHDIVRAGAIHSGPRLTVWLQVRRLAGSQYVATWDVRTPGDRWVLHYDTRVTPAYTSLFHGVSEVLDCEGLHGRKLPRKERVVVSVPRSCVNNPSWIRWGASMGRETDNYVLIDDARINAGFYANRCRLGPRVRHN